MITEPEMLAKDACIYKGVLQSLLDSMEQEFGTPYLFHCGNVTVLILLKVNVKITSWTELN